MKKDEKKFDLNPRHKKFCEEYVKCYNKKLAAINAGYSSKSAGSIGWELYRKDHIREYIAYLEQQAIENSSSLKDISQEDIYLEITRIAFSNIKDHFDKNGKLIPVPHLHRDEAAAISQEEKGKRRLHNKLEALKYLDQITHERTLDPKQTRHIFQVAKANIEHFDLEELN